jgi:hypothetical protein
MQVSLKNHRILRKEDNQSYVFRRQLLMLQCLFGRESVFAVSQGPLKSGT